jgi:dihydrolipoamide dehydrogenase
MFDLAVIGGGPGGYVAAIRAAQLGLKVCCIEERKELGGTCLNVGCIPSKALLYSSECYWKMKHEAAFLGIVCSDLSCNFSQMMKRKNEIVQGFVKGIDALFKKNKVERIHGKAQFKSPQEIEAAGNMIKAKHIILATGSEPISLPFLPLDEQRIVSSTGALSFTKIPNKLLIIGAGVIGVELGSVYSRLGSEVVFLEFLDRICPSFDRAVAVDFQKILTNQGLVFHLSHKVLKADIGSSLSVTAQGLNGEATFAADAILVCVGRRPYTKGLGLEQAGIQTDAKGFIPIDASFRTRQPHIFALGDLIEGPMLAHKASEEGIAVAELIAGERPHLDYLSIPSVAYTFPEVASVGLTEEDAKAKNLSIKVGRFPFKANSRARCTGEDEGFVKIICDAVTKRLLGVHILGPHASELIAEGVLAIQMKATALQLADTPHAHPTFSEALKEAAMAAVKSSIHF